MANSPKIALGLSGVRARERRGARPSLWNWLASRPLLARCLFIAALLVAWEAAARLFGDPLFVAPPTAVAWAAPKLLATQGLPFALLTTAWELLLAFSISLFFGFWIGLTLGRSSFANRAFMPIVVMLYALPQITLIPIFMMGFGIGPASKVAYGVSHGVFPVILTIAAGMRNLKPVLLASSKSMGASDWKIMRHVLMPHAVTSLFSGMRLGMNAALLGVILAELYASKTGVGYFARKFAVGFDPKMLFGLIAIVALLAVLMNESLRRVEIRMNRWRSA